MEICFMEYFVVVLAIIGVAYFFYKKGKEPATIEVRFTIPTMMIIPMRRRKQNTIGTRMNSCLLMLGYILIISTQKVICQKERFPLVTMMGVAI